MFPFITAENGRHSDFRHFLLPVRLNASFHTFTEQSKFVRQRAIPFPRNCTHAIPDLFAKCPHSANLKKRIYRPEKFRTYRFVFISAITSLYRNYATCFYVGCRLNVVRAGRRQRLPGAIGTAAHGEKRIDAATPGTTRIFDRGELNEGVRHGRSMAARSGRRSGTRGARMP
ncbi:hypothetical protein KDW36_21655 [Burkholderia dolosa]|uniref:hypothetical protein n=1 Tax=Burkholderia dolosa TaxID=152500 RepID=UPI001B9297FE|nr:hypothetical protein [Burkholderia dolosa]MBR8315791.1 hypothetical protein [Burkholderia dolosa]